MSGLPDKIEVWQMLQPTTKDKDTGEMKPGKLAKASIPVPPLAPDEVLVKGVGCGVCQSIFDKVYQAGSPVRRIQCRISKK